MRKRSSLLLVVGQRRMFKMSSETKLICTEMARFSLPRTNLISLEAFASFSSAFYFLKRSSWTIKIKLRRLFVMQNYGFLAFSACDVLTLILLLFFSLLFSERIEF